jgi:hypothetical protein
MERRRQRNMPAALMSAIVVLGGTGAALADESGVSFWLLGTYATQAAVPSDPGLSIDMTYYSAGASAGALGELLPRRPHRGRARHGIELHPADADLDIRAESAGWAGLVRRHRAVGQLRLDRIG